ncbi:hypothetical protein PRVXH_000086 [Proteinivorax hydrogeniformans]|uniref:Ppx/GppA phosphatase N-terminal domain-containing protein n=1 Tax=Proteinivorax hydrogeniformans TaxID=1826727 RepID=A0AAU8HTP5_9FIRM
MIAVIDIGSNSIRLLIAEVKDGQIINVSTDRVVTRLGQSKVLNTLDRAKMQKTFKALKRFKDQCKSRGIKRIYSFATSAVREADNREQFVSEVRNMGIPCQVISGQREAKLSFKGAALALKTEDFVMMDLGGGSLELCYKNNKGEIFGRSYKIGAVRYTQKFIKSDPPQKEEISLLKSNLAEEIKKIKKNIGGDVTRKGLPLVAVGGTAFALAAVYQKVQHDRKQQEKIVNTKMPISFLKELTTKLESGTILEREKILGLHRQRAEIIVAGANILLTTASKLGYNILLVTDGDLRQGFISEIAN